MSQRYRLKRKNAPPVKTPLDGAGNTPRTASTGNICVASQVKNLSNGHVEAVTKVKNRLRLWNPKVQRKAPSQVHLRMVSRL